MNTLKSKDGTTIAFDEQGDGPAVILVDGAMSTHASGSKPELARLLAKQSKVYSYDRRGRGDSGDTQPYGVEREIDDLDALIDRAGGSAFVYGHSSGGCLALEATVRLGDKIKRLAVYEVPYNDDPAAQKAWGEYIQNLTAALASGRRGDAVALFMAYVGIPAAQIDEMRRAPFWGGMEAIAPTLAYDHTAIIGQDGVDSYTTGGPDPRAHVTDERRQRRSFHARDGQDAQQGDPKRQTAHAERSAPRCSAGGARSSPGGILC